MELMIFAPINERLSAGHVGNSCCHANVPALKPASSNHRFYGKIISVGDKGEMSYSIGWQLERLLTD